MRATNEQSILAENKKYRVNGQLWIECDGARFFGPGRVELLKRIDATGSINKAAKEMQMSYKKAWEMVNILNTQAARPFVIMQSGGQKGGGSSITEEARSLIAYHDLMRERFLRFLKSETEAFEKV